MVGGADMATQTYVDTAEADAVTTAVATQKGNELDMGANDIVTTGKVKFANVYATDGDHSPGGYILWYVCPYMMAEKLFLPAGNWVELAKQSASYNCG